MFAVSFCFLFFAHVCTPPPPPPITRLSSHPFPLSICLHLSFLQGSDDDLDLDLSDDELEERYQKALADSDSDDTTSSSRKSKKKKSKRKASKSKKEKQRDIDPFGSSNDDDGDDAGDDGQGLGHTRSSPSKDERQSGSMKKKQKETNIESGYDSMEEFEKELDSMVLEEMKHPSSDVDESFLDSDYDEDEEIDFGGALNAYGGGGLEAGENGNLEQNGNHIPTADEMDRRRFSGSKCNNAIWGLLFIVHVIVYVSWRFSNHALTTQCSRRFGIIFSILFAGGLGIVSIVVWLWVSQRLVWVSQIASIFTTVLYSILLSTIPGSTWHTSIFLILVAISMTYWLYIARVQMLQFSGAIVEMISGLLKDNVTIIIIAGGMLFLQLIWFIILGSSSDMVGFMDGTTKSHHVLYFFFTFYWSTQTLKYIVHAAVSGAVGQWYFAQGDEEAAVRESNARARSEAEAEQKRILLHSFKQ